MLVYQTNSVRVQLFSQVSAFYEKVQYILFIVYIWLPFVLNMIFILTLLLLCPALFF